MSRNRWISPADLASSIGECRSIAFVGNSSGVVAHENGPLIDQCDVVVRFNRFETAGFERAVGRKVSLYVCTGVGGLSASEVQARCSSSDLRAIVAITPIEYVSRLIVANRLALSVPDLALPTLSLLASMSEPDRALAERGGKLRRWTTGTYAIYLITLLLRPSQIFLSGFDLFSVDHASGHYFDLSPTRRARGDILRHHTPDAEAELWRLMLPMLGCRVCLSKDVAATVSGIVGLRNVSVEGEPDIYRAAT